MHKPYQHFLEILKCILPNNSDNRLLVMSDYGCILVILFGSLWGVRFSVATTFGIVGITLEGHALRDTSELTTPGNFNTYLTLLKKLKQN